MTQAAGNPGRNTVVSETGDGYCRLTLNRPERRNALTGGVLRELHACLRACHEDEDVRAVLITAAGMAFCAGQDLNDRDPRKLSAPVDLEAIQKELFHPVLRTIRAMEKPVVVAVNGVAAGAGSSLALAGDIVIAARSAQFAQSFAKVGLSVDAGGGWQLVRALGPARARAFLMTAGSLTAEEAERSGLIWKCVDDTALEREAKKLLARLVAGPTRAYAGIKAAIAAAEEGNGFEAYLAAEARLQGAAGATHDYREGVLSFLERRPADFKGN
ncbi:MAG: enoyl-CoA hydratase-related protein [Paracoccaceae bacterium]